jgi:hypothetical protein
VELIGATYIGDIRSRSERSQICRPLPNDFVIPVHLEVGQKIRLCFLDQLLLTFLEHELFFGRQGFPCQLDDITGGNVRAIL